ncbi:MAG: phosphotransferase [Verrucomicrobiota bacterium]
MNDELLLTETRRRFPAYDSEKLEMSAIEKGGSDRRFYRVCCEPEQSLILVKYNRNREENRHYVDIAEFLSQNGIRAPKIYFHDPDEGLIWVEDLGEADLFSYRREGWRERRSKYASALEEIAKLHEIPESGWAPWRSRMPPAFNASLYEWEQSYFFENCLGRVFHLPENEVTRLQELPALQRIADTLAALPRDLVHRDFQSQNIVLRDGDAYLIDFQGMRPGLAEYDLASLLYDPYVSLSGQEREELAIEYWEHRGLGSEIAERQERLRLCAMQRLMQALGAYGFLGVVKKNEQFLRHIDGAMRSLEEVLAEHKEVEPLRNVLTSLRQRVPADLVH